MFMEEGENWGMHKRQTGKGTKIVQGPALGLSRDFVWKFLKKAKALERITSSLVCARLFIVFLFLFLIVLVLWNSHHCSGTFCLLFCNRNIIARFLFPCFLELVGFLFAGEEDT